MQVRVCLLFLTTFSLIADDWPQWLGPNRDGVSVTRGLLTSWPEGGPAEVWRKRIGRGFSGVSVSAGKAYTMMMDGEGEYAVGLDALTGKELWRAKTGPIYRESQGGDGPRGTPAIDRELVYVLGANGALEALDAAKGTRKWAVDLKKEFGSVRPGWGFSSSPLIEGSPVLVEGGDSDDGTAMTFDKIAGARRPIRWGVHRIRQGDTLYIRWNGGGGYGDPLDREPERVRRDVAGQTVSLDAARDIFGVDLDAAGAVDAAATEHRRDAMRARRRSAEAAE